MDISQISWFFLHTYIRMYAHAYVHTYIRTYVCMYVHTYIHTYVCTYVCTYIRTRIHTYTPISPVLAWFSTQRGVPKSQFLALRGEKKAPSAQGRGYFWAARRCCGPFWRIFGAAAREARRLRGFFMPKNLKKLTNLIWAPMILVDLEWF